MFFFTVFIGLHSFAQERTVKGTVTDESGMPVPGVSVLVKGTSTGVETDFDGKYSIKALTNQLLVFSMIGMTKQELPANSTTINVKMKEDAQELEGVVLTALGVEVKKNQAATAFSKVKSETLRTTGETSVLKSLSAKASNVNIVSNSGDPGSGSYIQIRGQNTITGNTQPLFVIDGIPVSNDEIGSTVDGTGQQSRMNDINPNDIESVQIMKGTSASALWGYRAANGVVLITTKKGKAGSLKIDLNTTYSHDQVNVRFETQDKFGQGLGGVWRVNNANSYGDLISRRSGASDVFLPGNNFVSENGTTYFRVGTKNSKANFNDSNYDAVIGNGFSIDKHLGISGGNENGNFYVGLGHIGQEGIIRNSSYERTSIDFSNTYKLGSKTTFKGKFSFSSINSNRVQQGSNLSGLLLGLYRSPADFDNRDYKGTFFNAAGIPFYNSHRAYRQDIGTFDYSPSGPRDLNPSYNNPLWTTDVQKNPNTVYRYIAGFQLQHEISKYITLLGRFGIDAYSDKRISMFPRSSAENGGLGSATENVTDFQQFNADIMAMGDVVINKDINLNYTVGLNIGETDYAQRGGSYINFLIDTDKFSYDNSVIADRTTFLDRSKQRLSGAYFNTSFDYKNYLFATIGGRFETSSTFAPNLKTYFYPSVETAWKFSENLNKSFLNLGKLRATYGQVAIIPQPYRGVTYFVGGAGSEGWGPAYDSGAYSGSFARSGLGGNINLIPEIKTEVELGLDIEFLNRFTINTTYYTNKIKDNLVNAPINGSSSYSSLYGNFADIENKGIEVEFNAKILKDTELKWSIYGNWARNRNLVTRLENTESLFLNGFTGASSRAVLGQPLGVLWGGKWDRDGNGNLILDANGFPTVAPSEGVIGDPNPDWRGAIGTRFEYKGFSVNALFDASIGGDLWDGTNGALNNFGKTVESGNILTFPNQSAANFTGYNGANANTQGWINADGTYSVRGNITDFGAGPVFLNQAWYQSLGGGFGPVAEQFVKSASWVKFRELTIAYSINSKLLEKTGVAGISLSLTGRNLWMWMEADNLYQDPETNLTGGSNGRGLQYFNHPNTKSFIASINIKF